MGTVFISENACAPLMKRLEQEGHRIYKVKATDTVYPAIAAHPDIYLCRAGSFLSVDETISTEPSLREEYEQVMEERLGNASEAPMVPAMPLGSGADGSSVNIVFEMGNIGYKYPYDVAYNAVSTSHYFIHNLEYTAPPLLDRARAAGLHFINVRQGYTKCSCLVVGDNGIITADRGIAAAIEAWNEDPEEPAEGEVPIPPLEVLLIEEGNVILEDFNHGFIGGASGMIGTEIWFNGRLEDHPDADKIRRFIADRGYAVVDFPEEPLTDIGSIIWIP